LIVCRNNKLLFEAMKVTFNGITHAIEEVTFNLIGGIK
jgi:hypothetical protein